MRSYNQKELIEALKRGEKDAFKYLVEMLSPKIYRLCLKIAKNPFDAEEILQEVFLHIIEKIDSFEGRSSIDTWAYSITMNTALSYLKKRDKASLQSIDEIDDEKGLPKVLLRNIEEEWPDDIKDPILRKELNQKIEEAIDNLPHAYKEIFILKEIEGLSIKQLKEIFHLNEGTIKTRLHRARLYLRSALGDYFKEWNQKQ